MFYLCIMIYVLVPLSCLLGSFTLLLDCIGRARHVSNPTWLPYQCSLDSELTRFKRWWSCTSSGPLLTLTRSIVPTHSLIFQLSHIRSVSRNQSFCFCFLIYFSKHEAHSLVYCSRSCPPDSGHQGYGRCRRLRQRRHRGWLCCPCHPQKYC